MILLSHVWKTHKSRGVEKCVARDLCFRFPTGQAMALLGRNGAGKSSLLQLISGISRPDQGRILRRGSVSWPVGFQGSFHPDLSGLGKRAFCRPGLWGRYR